MSKTILKGIAVATALTFGAVSFASSADAGGRHHRHHKRHHGGHAAAAAILGFGLAAALASRPSYDYSYGYAAPYAYAPPPPPPPAYYGPTYYSGNYAPQIWSPAWYRYCSQKYISFDPRNGTYQPYHGPRQLCR